MFYSSIPVEDLAVLTAAFDKKYGVKVKVWRADSEGFLQRIVNEAKAKRYEVDVMAGSSSALEPLHREKLLSEVKSPYLADLIPESIAPHREWASVYLNTIVQAYNTDLVKKESLPKTYRDLLKPEWKDRLGIEAEDFDWFAQVVHGLGEAEGLRLFREIVASNGISVRKGHTLLNNLVAAGEVPLALTVYGFTAEQTKRKGAPLDWFIIPPLVARPTAAGVARNAPHPYASVLFFDFPDRRRPADPGEPPVRVAEPQDRIPLHQGAAGTHRFRPDARSGAEMAGSLPEDHYQSVAMSYNRKTIGRIRHGFQAELQSATRRSQPCGARASRGKTAQA